MTETSGWINLIQITPIAASPAEATWFIARRKKGYIEEIRTLGYVPRWPDRQAVIRQTVCMTKLLYHVTRRKSMPYRETVRTQSFLCSSPSSKFVEPIQQLHISPKWGCSFVKTVVIFFQ